MPFDSKKYGASKVRRGGIISLVHVAGRNKDCRNAHLGSLARREARMPVQLAWRLSDCSVVKNADVVEEKGVVRPRKRAQDGELLCRCPPQKAIEENTSFFSAY